uniref:G_PROTEIN_RECEP_F1_2 domain-containing protein n=1 Tax=Ascaris lumbricoides TaxID=6252 RepID=A0A0M3HXS3_ASCLU
MDNLDAEVVLDDLYELSVYELIFWCLMYSLIAFLAVAGNALVLWITLNRFGHNSITNLFIINLAFSDLMTGLFAIPFKFQAALFQRWFLPRFLCQLVPFTETLSLSVSVFTLTASAVHEFRTVFLPKNGQMSSLICRVLLIVIWMIAIAISLPQGLFHEVFRYEENANTTIYQCRPIYADDDWWKAYNIYLTIIHYFVPLVVIDSAYSMIAFRLVKMLAIVVAVFSLCWFPLETYLLLNEIQPQINEWRYINVLFFCCHWLAMSNSCLNPIIYGVYNNKYKREYRRVFMRLRCNKMEECNDDGDFSTSNRETPKLEIETATSTRMISGGTSSTEYPLNGLSEDDRRAYL